ncbi:MAG: LamG domain-containing protein [Anaerolineae bacterium]|nr:LamG domain-containing protein [Anaerolineae bacterium]
MTTLSLHIDFDSDGFGAGDDLSAYLLRGEAALGLRDGDPDRLTATPGRLTLILNNADRRFSPENAAGPYAGRLRPNLPIRLRAMPDGGAPITLFRGVTADWLPMPGEHGPRTCTLECTDLLGVLARAPLGLPLCENVRGDTLVRHILNTALSAPAAAGQAVLAANPADGDWLAIDGVRFTFKTALQSGAPNQVKIGAGVEDSVDALVAALNGGAGAGALYTVGTVRPDRVRASPNGTYLRHVRGDGALRHYRLGESGGVVAHDSGSNGRDGTYLGAIPGAAGALGGDPDGAASFDGVNDCVDLPPLALDRRPFTLEIWARPDAGPPSGAQCLIGVDGGPGRQIRLSLWPDGALTLTIGGDTLYSPPGALAFGVWQHVACTFAASDGDTGLAALYVDGAPVRAGSLGAFTAELNALRMALGGLGQGVEPFKGQLDEAAIYPVALDAGQLAAHVAAAATPRGVRLTARIPGAAGNAIPLQSSGPAIQISGAALSGGLDAPRDPAPDLDAGTQTFDLAGERWAEDRSAALDALRDVTAGERGLCWAGRDGALRWRNAHYLMRRAAATPALEADGEARAYAGQAEAVLASAAHVTYTPRVTLAEGVVARSTGVLLIPGQSGARRFDPAAPLVHPGGGERTFTLAYVDPATGQPAGARDLVLPLQPGEDWAANEQPDGSGPDYTGSPSLSFEVEAGAAGVRITVRNTALGPLFLTRLQVRGKLITAYDPARFSAEDAGARALFGARAAHIDLPLPVSAQFAEAVAQHLLSRRKTPINALTRLETARPALGGVNVLGLEIGDVIGWREAQTGVAAALYLVAGLEYRIGPGGLEGAILHVRRLDDQRYAIYDDAQHGRYDTADVRYGL